MYFEMDLYGLANLKIPPSILNSRIIRPFSF